MTLVAGIDSSTQSCKVLVCDADTGEIVRTGRASHPAGTEVAPEAWWEALQTAVADAGGLDDVAAVSVGGQQHGMVALDERGEVIRPALLWNDTRSAPDAERMISDMGDGDAELGAERWAERTGMVPVASYTATKLSWLARAEPENAKRVAAVCLPHDWLSWRLAGHGPVTSGTAAFEALATDRSDVSGTGYYDAATGEYRLDIVENVLGHVPQLPRVLGPLESQGKTAAGALIGPGAGDNAAAALGIGAVAGDVVFSIGTSGVVSAVSDTPTRDTSGLVAGFADATGRYLPLVCTLNAALVMNSVASLLGVDPYGFDDLAMQGKPGEMRMVPYFAGERTPNLPDSTGSLHGITLDNFTPAGLARASVEGVVCSLADAYAALRRMGVGGTRAILVGGGARYRSVQESAAQVLGLPIMLPEPGEYVAVGAARQAAGVLRGEMPEWPVSGVELTSTPLAEPLAGYRKATSTLWPDAAIS